MTITSSGSPSSAVVEGTKPQSCGYVKPTKRDFVSVKASSFGSKANFARLPRGVSTTTFTAPSSAKGGRDRFGIGRLDLLAKAGVIGEAQQHGRVPRPTSYTRRRARAHRIAERMLARPVQRPMIRDDPPQAARTLWRSSGARSLAACSAELHHQPGRDRWNFSSSAATGACSK